MKQGSPSFDESVFAEEVLHFWLGDCRPKDFPPELENFLPAWKKELSQKKIIQFCNQFSEFLANTLKALEIDSALILPKDSPPFFILNAPAPKGIRNGADIVKSLGFKFDFVDKQALRTCDYYAKKEITQRFVVTLFLDRKIENKDAGIKIFPSEKGVKAVLI